MWDVLSWLFFIVFIAGLIIAGGLLVRGYLASGGTTKTFGSGMFAAKPDKRVEVVEQTTLDGRRKLVLIRRDNVEHLVMVGGPIDVIVESGIDTRRELRSASLGGEAGTGSATPRPARSLGQAANG
ncbi:MAG: hypothetical protein AAFV26_05125 [Pseudomonadota bacterium]